MSTVPLRKESASRWERPVRPRLVLEDCTQEQRPSPAKKARRLVSRRWEDRLFAAAAATVLLFFLISFALSLYHSAALSYKSPLASPAAMTVTVHPGDTLWTYAREYGSPDVYILDRVETIALANHLASDAPLVPGQRLLIPLTDPAQITQLQRAHRLARR
ncbi:MAG: LysM peptidoglycan-binding domain-containing protein [Armatimonadetes bacterium]|nr:LysM peptidoglycan-binding domain-containing protein [Armatimonadota bacterium]